MQLALRNATVVVLGSGGLGSWTMAGLACAGVGRIVAVDDDTIELSNLNRQVLYRTSDIGRRKVEVAAEALRGLNPDIDFVPLLGGSGGSPTCAPWPPARTSLSARRTGRCTTSGAG